MEIIAHRRNTVQELIDTSTCYGIEMDIRSFGKDLVVHHEPFVKGELFDDWLKEYNHQTLILNVKEEGLETPVLELVKKYNIQKYFFLDQSFPFLVKTSRQGIRECAVRVSEFESLETALSIAPHIDWCWVDCFDELWITKEQTQALQNAGLSLCLVSPELQGFEAEKFIPLVRQKIQERNLSFEAVCTKKPDLWK